MTAWLMIAAGEERQYGGNFGYDDDPATHYSWDDTVPNHERPKPGDIIVLWDKSSLIGMATIERIVGTDTEKRRLRCPSCHQTKIRLRAQEMPRFRCYRDECLAEFDEPKEERLRVHTYRSEHAATWVDLRGELGGPTLRSLCVRPKSMNSLRELDWERFRSQLDVGGLSKALTGIDVARREIASGHRTVTARVRLGQGEFRRRMRDQFGDVCAFTGPQPADALDAAHLYSYAADGKHRDDGGLLLRKDVHRLFDLGLLAINPVTGCIDVLADLRRFSGYANLHEKLLQVTLQASSRKWLAEHWQLHRG